jgi:hypothetical protein
MLHNITRKWFLELSAGSCPVLKSLAIDSPGIGSVFFDLLWWAEAHGHPYEVVAVLDREREPH